jgi:osmotically-inducible protein OsmY
MDMKKILFAALGAAGATYLFDPQNGARRRNVARDRVAAFFRRRSRGAAQRARYAQGVAQGAVHQATAAVSGDKERTYDDATLTSKVESEIFRAPDAPKGRVNVNVEHGIVYLRGELDRPEQIESLVAAARQVDGVRDVQSLLHLEGTPAPTKADGARPDKVATGS